MSGGWSVEKGKDVDVFDELINLTGGGEGAASKRDVKEGYGEPRCVERGHI